MIHIELWTGNDIWGFCLLLMLEITPPYHVHILTSSGRNIGRFDIENQRPMDDFEVSQKLKKALIDLGYMRKELEK